MICNKADFSNFKHYQTNLRLSKTFWHAILLAAIQSTLIT